uniref:Uncharacterized protein n=1 Tax=Astyanax mexicanus TaxID=7994 RepID=A0A3B1JHP9_ASTMX
MDTPFSGLELVFIFIAFTVFCVFSIAAIYTHNQPDTQGHLQCPPYIGTPGKMCSLASHKLSFVQNNIGPRWKKE